MEKELQRNVVSTSDTAGLHTYFLRRSAIKFTLLLKNNNHEPISTNNTICLFVWGLPFQGRRDADRGRLCFCVWNWGGGRNYSATHSWPAAHIHYCSRFAFPIIQFQRKTWSSAIPSPLSHPPTPSVREGRNRTRRGVSLEAEEEAEPRRSNGV